nr:hypothetical protein CFP56_44832 [Quercus suber]
MFERVNLWQAVFKDQISRVIKIWPRLERLLAIWVAFGDGRSWPSKTILVLRVQVEGSRYCCLLEKYRSYG